MKKISLVAGAFTALALLATGVLAAPAQAGPSGTPGPGTPRSKSLAQVLAADGNVFDDNWMDYDIVDRAVHKVLAEKPNSPVKVLASGTTPLTAFLPNDLAFRRLVKNVTGVKTKGERGTWKRVKEIVGNTTTLEQILLYHVVPATGTTGLAAADVALLNEQTLATALTPKTFKVVVAETGIYLQDLDSNAGNPKVVQTDINKWNYQVAHGISAVLRPIDLPPLA